MPPEMKECRGCGAKAAKHPMVMIGREDDDANKDMVSYPVCNACWQDPEHRTARMLKGHFHFVSNEMAGLIGAKIVDAKSKAGEDISLG